MVLKPVGLPIFNLSVGYHGKHGKHGTSSNNPFVLELRMMTEIREQSEPVPSGLQVIVKLSPMLIAKGRDCLDLDDDGPETEEVRLVTLAKNLAFVAEFQLRLRHEGNAL
jgi:hypothetical protein